MSAFTVLGLLVFWVWCFEFGYLLGWVATCADLLVSFFRLERQVTKDIKSFAAMCSVMVPAKEAQP